MFALYPQITSERFDHRLTQEIGGLRLEMHQGFAALRHEMAQIRVDVLKWSLLFWISQFTAMIGTLSYMLDGR